MNKLSISLLLTLVTNVFSYYGQYIKTKDGVIFGVRKEFMKVCVESAKEKFMKINGLEFEVSNYCGCISDKLIPSLTSEEIDKAMSENSLSELILKEKNFETLLSCLDGNYKLSGDFKYGETKDSELAKKAGVSKCIIEVMKQTDLEDWTKEKAETYCICVVEKMINAGYTHNDILQITDQNGLAYNEIAVPCLNEAYNNVDGFKSLNSYIQNDIIGSPSQTKISLTDYFGQGYKLKISIGGLEKYYLFDTGASDLIIDKETEKELLSIGVLKKENYLQETKYSLANNEIVNAQLVKVNNFVIGDYTLNNVTIAIIENGSLLCGKSFLDKFSKWEIDKVNSVLILYK